MLYQQKFVLQYDSYFFCSFSHFQHSFKMVQMKSWKKMQENSEIVYLCFDFLNERIALWTDTGDPTLHAIEVFIDAPHAGNKRSLVHDSLDKDICPRRKLGNQGCSSKRFFIKQWVNSTFILSFPNDCCWCYDYVPTTRAWLKTIRDSVTHKYKTIKPTYKCSLNWKCQKYEAVSL